MNWRLGFFRVWIAVSALWLLFAGAINQEPVRDAFAAHTYEATENATGRKLTIRATKAPTESEVAQIAEDDAKGYPRSEPATIPAALWNALLVGISAPCIL